MDIKSIVEQCNTTKQECFIHIKDLPWMASQKDIKDFFHGLSIRDGGIMIRHYDAFVAFEDPGDIDSAVRRDSQHLLNSEVQLSVITKPDLRKILFQIARRKLDFSENDGGSKKVRNLTRVSRQKKIRPTPVLRSKKRKVESSLIFCPIETDVPQEVKDVTYQSWAFDEELSLCKRKKIHPVRLPDILIVENFSTFHPEKCYEFKSVILDVS